MAALKPSKENETSLQFVDGVMVGREAYQNPSLLGYVDQMLFDANADIVTARQAVEAMFPYIEKQLSQGVYLNHIVRHMLGASKTVKERDNGDAI